MKVGNQNDFSQNLNQQFNKNNKEEKKTRHTGSEQNNKEDSLEDDNINGTPKLFKIDIGGIIWR